MAAGKSAFGYAAGFAPPRLPQPSWKDEGHLDVVQGFANGGSSFVGEPPKKFDFPGFEGHTEFFGPHPFTWKTPTQTENIRTQKFGFGFRFRAGF